MENTVVEKPKRGRPKKVLPNAAIVAQIRKDWAEPVQQAPMVPVTTSPAQMIRDAVTGGADLSKLEKLLELQEKWEANEARKAYHKAMAAFKANPPDIEKDKQVSYLQVKYRHATLANVTKKINEALSRHGLSASWKITQNGTVSVTCKITHEQGHSEETTLSAPADKTGSKNDIQAIGSTISYLQRYSLLALTGLATHDITDDDGKSAPAEFISEEEVIMVEEHLMTLGKGAPEKFLAYMKLEKLSDMPKSELPKAMAAIKQSKEAMERRGK